MDINKIFDLCRKYNITISFEFDVVVDMAVIKFYAYKTNRAYQQMIRLDDMLCSVQSIVIDCVIENALRSLCIDR